MSSPYRSMNEVSTINTSAMAQGAASDDADGDEPGLGSDPDQPPQPMRDPQTVLAIQCAIDPDKGVDLPWLESHLSQAISHIKQQVHRVVLKLVDDLEMTQLHQAHSDDNSTTDVLTFENSKGSDAIDVDIAICVDEAQRQAANRGHSINQELLLYALHGLLHCAGFNDQTDEQSQAIHMEEDRILQAIGVGAIYKCEESGHDDSCVADGRDRGAGS